MLPDLGPGNILDLMRGLRARLALGPILVMAVLALPCLGLGYFWDDFVFLARVRSSPIAALGFEPGAFYRPLPRVFFFWPLVPFGTSGALLAHLMNLALAAAAVSLLVGLVRDRAGDRAGAVAGMTYAGLAALPGLIAWASGCQDLLAIVLGLLALRLRDAGKLVASAVALAAALLSKETAVAFVPVLILWDVLVGRRPLRLGRACAAYGAVSLGWALLHPGLRLLAARGFLREPRAYVGFANLAVSEFHARQYLGALANAPAGGSSLHWTAFRVTMLGAALAIVLTGLTLAWRGQDKPDSRLSLWRALLLATLLTLPALALPSLMIQRYAAYFVCMPALGVSILAGSLLSRVPLALAATVVAAYVAMGFWSRQADTPGADALTERIFTDASRAIRKVERGFRSLHPTLPHGSQVLVSVASSGLLGIDGTIQDGQALSTFYRDATVRTLRPERRLPRPRAEFLFRIDGSQNVVEIDPDRGTTRSSGGNPDPDEMRAVTRTYARGLAATGETARSVSILRRLADQDPPELQSYDLRLASMACRAAGDDSAAARLTAQAPPLSREDALYDVAKVMAEPTADAALDSCAYEAFGISPRDPDAMRHFMELFYGSLLVPQALHFAERVQQMVPGDSESAAIRKELR